MSQAIEQIAMYIGNKKRTVMTAGGQLLGGMEMADNWNVMRFGLQVSFDGTSNAVGTPLLFFGLCRGAVLGTGFGNGSSTLHCLGIRMGTSAAWTYHAGPTPYYDGGAPTIVKKIGATITNQALATGFGSFQSADKINVRTALIMQVTKGSPNYTIDFVAPQSSGAAAQIDITDAKMTSFMEMGSLSSANSIATGYAPWGSATIAVDEGANGILDAVNIYWDKTAPALHIPGVRVKKIS